MTGPLSPLGPGRSAPATTLFLTRLTKKPEAVSEPNFYCTCRRTTAATPRRGIYISTYVHAQRHPRPAPTAQTRQPCSEGQEDAASADFHRRIHNQNNENTQGGPGTPGLPGRRADQERDELSLRSPPTRSPPTRHLCSRGHTQTTGDGKRRRGLRTAEGARPLTHPVPPQPGPCPGQASPPSGAVVTTANSLTVHRSCRSPGSTAGTPQGSRPGGCVETPRGPRRPHRRGDARSLGATP